MDAFLSDVACGYCEGGGAPETVYAWHPAAAFYERYLGSRAGPALGADEFCRVLCRIEGLTWQSGPLGEFYCVHRGLLGRYLMSR